MGIVLKCAGHWATVQVSWWWKETETAIPVISTVMMRICWEISKQILWKK